MFQNLPIEIEYMIYKFYYSKNVIPEINCIDSVWENPSLDLIAITKDTGRFEKGYTDLEDIFCDYLPHTDFMESLLDEEYLSNSIACETCIWELRSRCEHETWELNLVRMLCK